MPELFSRRDFLTGVLACGTLSAVATYLVPGGRSLPSVELKLVTGVDRTGARDLLIDMWEKSNPNTIIKKTVVDGETFDQRDKMIGAAKGGHADVLNLDMIHVRHFADQDLITPFDLEDVNSFLGTTLLASRVDNDQNRYWAAPFNTDVGMLFERLSGDRPSAKAHTLADVLDKQSPPANSPQFVGQLWPDSTISEEAFVVNILEHALSRDPEILDANGIPAYDLGRWQTALRPLRDAIAQDRIVKADTEGNALLEFADGARPRFMRNWPVKYRELQQSNDPDVKASRIRVDRLPIGILGGQSLALVKGSANASRAIEFIHFLTNEPAQKVLAAHGLAATRHPAYNDPNLKAFIPHLQLIRGAVEDARPRPIHRNYKDFSDVVVRHVTNLLHGGVDLPSQFIDDMRAALS